MKKQLFSALAVGLCLTANLMAQVPNYVPTNGLVGWWPFNGNANDESGNGNNGTVNGATLTTDRFGNGGNAYSFIKLNNNYITINNSVGNFGTSNFTISIWFLSSDPNVSALINKRYNESWGNWWELRSDLFGINEANNGTNYSSLNTSSNSLNIWHNCIIIRNSNSLKYFFNGYLIQETNTPVIHNVLNSNNLLLGSVIAPISGVLQSHDGKLDDIGIWNRALTECEIQDLYNSQINSVAGSILTSPQSAAVGSTVTLSSSTTSQSLQWQTNGVNLGWQNVPSNTIYSGGNTNTLTINNVQLSNHNQPFRLIATAGNCSDTSNVATIQIADTCITNVTIYDTLLTTVTDTLIINTTLSLPAPNNENTILIYPNPASDHITIDNGNFAAMAGYTIKIENNAGQQVFQSAINQAQFYVDLSTWSGNGLYFVHLIDAQGNTVTVRKIVLQ